MPKLGWKAIYEDGVIKQYPASKPETNYREVVAKGPPVKLFVGTNYGVNLQTGELLVKGKWVQFGDKDGRPLVPTALIYFRRNHKAANMGDMTKITTVSVHHFVGFAHSAGIVRLCIPDNGSHYSICIGAANEGPETMISLKWPLSPRGKD